MHIFSFEKKIIGGIEKNVNVLFFAIISVIALLLRWAGRNFLSADMYGFLMPWYETLKNAGGVKGLGEQVGDYNVLFQTLIAFMTYLPVKNIYLFKALSIIFDYLLAFSCAWMVSDLTGRKKFGSMFQVVYMVILFLPTVLLNSAWWGQCDVIYSFFVILMLYYLYKEKYLGAFIFFGVAFAFKFQTVFLLPFVICYYFYKKAFSICYLGISVAVFWFSGIIAYFNGRELLDPFKIYASQTGTYQNMFLNVSSFWMLVGDNYEWMKSLAMQMTLVLCGLGLYAVIRKHKKMRTIEQFLNTATWFIWVCVMFLPAMHERYTYLLDILLILLACINMKYLKYAATSVLLSLVTYGAYLFGYGGIDKWHVLIYVGFWLHFTYTIMKQDLSESDVQENIQEIQKTDNN
ncbi:MAG: hypothetical protein IKL07_08080 [Clostridium sp.]|nr:hypothetical protein [Clostridium sp.]